MYVGHHFVKKFGHSLNWWFKSQNILEFTLLIFRCRVDFRDAPSSNSFVNLNVIVEPKQIAIFDENWKERNTFVGPYLEGENMKLICQAIGGRLHTHYNRLALLCHFRNLHYWKISIKCCAIYIIHKSIFFKDFHQTLHNPYHPWTFILWQIPQFISSTNLHSLTKPTQHCTAAQLYYQKIYILWRKPSKIHIIHISTFLKISFLTLHNYVF